ncbi:MAG: hypothetical protein PWQ31_1303 [Eubacteriales bacterium]|nr:hypothetical protein [Eubacteriales bacterium]
MDWRGYDEILEKSGIITRLQDEREVKKLQAMVKWFRKCYNTSDKVCVDYDDEIRTLAYFLTYYPAHAYQLYLLLHYIPRALFRPFFAGRSLRVTFVGPGPGSDIYGLTNFVRENLRPRIAEMEVAVVERELPFWQKYIDYSLDYSRNYFQVGIGSSDYLACDLSNCFACHSSCRAFSFDGPAVVVMQNLINEKTVRQEAFLAGVERLAARLHPGSLLIFSETFYDINRDTLEEVARKITADGCCHLVKFINNPVLVSLSYSYRPEVLRVLNGEDGLIPKHNVKFYGLILQKKMPAMRVAGW